MLTISIDTGGTFTDGYFRRGDVSRSVKVDTTPHDLVECLMNCLRSGAEAYELSLEALLREATSLRYATTVTTNTLVQKSGAPVGLITSDNEDGDWARETFVYDLIHPARFRTITGAVDDRGEVERPLDADALMAAVRDILAAGSRIIAVALSHSWQNPSLEREARARIKEGFPRHYVGAVPVFLSSDVAARGPQAAATTSVVLDAYLHRSVAESLYRAARELRRRGLTCPLLVMHSSGGVARVAKTVGLNTYGSGPAAGIFGASELAKELTLQSAVLLDIGGTSTDIAVASPEEPAPRARPSVEQYVVATPGIEALSIGGGGGSIIRHDGEMLRVGPESAGASPGPACYGLGGTAATIADANVVLGLLDPDYFLGGRRKLDPERARRALASVKPDLDPLETANDARRTVDGAIARAIESVMQGEGVSRETAALVAFGGGGGLHAAAVAERLNFDRVIVPAHSAVFSAKGGATMNLRHLYECWLGHPDETETSAALLLDAAQRDLLGEGVRLDDAAFEFAFAPDGEHFETADVGRALPGHGVLRLVSQAPVAQGSGEPPAEKAQDSPVVKGSRSVTWPSAAEPASIETQLYELESVRHGHEIAGPAILEGVQTTIAVPIDWTATRDVHGHVLLSHHGS